jgi:hypothetical protein
MFVLSTFFMETHEHIERRTFVGETSTSAFDGFAGFRLGKEYQLRYTCDLDELRISQNKYAKSTPAFLFSAGFEPLQLH